MQELSEGNVYNVQDVFGANLNASALGLKKFNSEVKSQLFDYMKRNNIQNPEEVIKKTFGDILEDVDIGDFESIGDSGAIGQIIDPNNQTGAGAVIVTNPKGAAYKEPTSGFGMGFALSPTLVPNIQQFIKQYGGNNIQNAESQKYELERSEAEAEIGEDPQELQNMTWQKINTSVANYVSQNLKDTLQKFHVYLPDEMYQTQQTTAPTNTYHYDPYSRQVYRVGKFKIEN
jgi:hypothetical protein